MPLERASLSGTWRREGGVRLGHRLNGVHQPVGSCGSLHTPPSQHAILPLLQQLSHCPATGWSASHAVGVGPCRRLPPPHQLRLTVCMAMVTSAFFARWNATICWKSISYTAADRAERAGACGIVSSCRALHPAAGQPPSSGAAGWMLVWCANPRPRHMQNHTPQWVGHPRLRG